MPDMKDIANCAICGRKLRPAGHRIHVDTCSERCYSKLLDIQRIRAEQAG